MIAVADRGTMFDPGPCVYMEKIATGPEAADLIDITKSPTDNLKAVAEAKSEFVRDLTAVILDRDRHDDLIAEVREAGARIRLIPDGDVAGAISTAWPNTGADILFGIGGTPEGVITAAAIKCMGGARRSGTTRPGVCLITCSSAATGANTRTPRCAPTSASRYRCRVRRWPRRSSGA